MNKQYHHLLETAPICMDCEVCLGVYPVDNRSQKAIVAYHEALGHKIEDTLCLHPFLRLGIEVCSCDCPRCEKEHRDNE